MTVIFALFTASEIVKFVPIPILAPFVQEDDVYTLP